MTSISIIVPLFNKRAYVASTVAELAGQLGPHDELIVVDDCSTDDGAAVVEALHLARVRLMHMPANGGPGSARNLGADHASGEFLLFFDADDRPRPDLLAVLRGCIERFPQEAVFAFDIAFEAHGERIEPGPVFLDGGASPQLLPKDAFVHSCLDGRPLCTASSTCVRAHAFLASGGFRPGLRYCEDPELWTRLSAAHGIVQIPHRLALYQDVPMSLSHDQRVTPGAVQPYVDTLMLLSRRHDDPYARLARAVIAKNVVFSISRGGNRQAMADYLRSVKSVLGARKFAGLRLLTVAPRRLLRAAFWLRAATRGWHAGSRA